MKFSFKERVWIWPGGTSAWHFVNVPKNISEKIKKKFGANARGWGSLRVQAKLGKTTWETSIFPDKRSGTYLLPMKASVRKTEGVYADDSVRINCKLI